MSIADAVTAGINFAALLFLGAQVMLARKALKETAKGQEREWERQRRQSSIEVSISTGQYRDSLRSVLPWNDRDPKEVMAFLDDAKDDREKLDPLRQYLNHLDDLAVGVKQGVFDIGTISMLQGSNIIDVFANYTPYIESIRRMLDRPSIYENLEDLAHMLKSLRSEPMEPSSEEARNVLRARHVWLHSKIETISSIWQIPTKARAEGREATEGQASQMGAANRFPG